MVTLRYNQWKKTHFKFDSDGSKIIISNPNSEATIVIQLHQGVNVGEVDTVMKHFADIFYSQYVAEELIKRARYGYK